MINCSLCCNAYDKLKHLPRILIQCGHTLCEQCLRNILQSQSEFNCPECQTVTIVEQDRLESEEQIQLAINRFPKNLALINIQEYGQLSLRGTATANSLQLQTQQSTTCSGQQNTTSSAGVVTNSSQCDVSKSKTITNSNNEIKSHDIESDEDNDEDDNFQNSSINNDLNIEDEEDQHQASIHSQNLLCNNNRSKNASGTQSQRDKNPTYYKKGNHSTTSSQNSTSAAGNNYQCLLHFKKIKAYCATDRSLLCIDCIVLTDNHKAHEIIATTKAYEQEQQTLYGQNEQALILKDKLENMKLDIESHMEELNIKANVQRQEITEIYTRIRKILQNRETELKKDIASKLENEEVRLKIVTKNIKQQMKLIQKFQDDYSKSQKENETCFLSKVNLRDQKSRKALQEIDNLDYPKVFSDFNEKEELQKISKIITCRKTNKQAASMMGTGVTGFNQPITQTINMSLTMSSSLKAQLKSNKKSNNHNNNQNHQPRVNKINLISTNPLSQTQSIPCQTVSIASLRSRSRDKNETLFKSKNLIKRSPQVQNPNNHHQMSQQVMSSSVSAFKVDLNTTQTLEFSPNIDQELRKNIPLQKASHSLNEKIMNNNQQQQQQQEQQSQQQQTPLSDETSTEREYYQSHVKQQNKDTINNIQHSFSKTQNLQSMQLNTYNANNHNHSVLSNHYTSINTATVNMNNTLNSSQHQMFGKHTATSSKLRNKKDPWANGQITNSYSNNNNLIHHTFSNQNSAKKQHPSRVAQKLISTTINLKDLVDSSNRSIYEKTMHSQRDYQQNTFKSSLTNKLIIDQKRGINSSATKNIQNKPPHQHQSSQKKQQNQRQYTSTITNTIDKLQAIDMNKMRLQQQDDEPTSTRTAMIKNTLKPISEINIHCNKISNNHLQQHNEECTSEFEGIFDEDDFDENHDIKTTNIIGNRSKNKNSNNNTDEYYPFSTNQQSLKKQGGYHHTSDNRLLLPISQQQNNNNNLRDKLGKQLPYNEDFFSRKHQNDRRNNQNNNNNLRCSTTIKKAAECNIRDLGYYNINPTPKQLNFSEWENLKIHQCNLDDINNGNNKNIQDVADDGDHSQIVTNSMIQQQDNYHSQQYGNSAMGGGHLDLLNQLYQRTESYLFAISGYQESPLNSIEKYDAQRGIWTEIQGAMTIPRTKFQSVVCQDGDDALVYILGGKKFDGQRTDTIEVFNPRAGDVKQISQRLPKPRSGFASVCIGNQIILVGGNDGKVLNKVDALDLTSMTWMKLPSLNYARDELAVALGPDMKIYAVGGYGYPDNTCLNSAERFDPVTGKWEMLPPMNECRRSLTLVALPDGIYAIGGYNGKHYLSSVEKFDESRNKWVMVSSMNNERCTLSAVPSPDYQYIYVLGGFNGKPLNVVERYSVLNDVWEFVNPMKRARFMHACCFVSIKNNNFQGDNSNTTNINILGSPTSNSSNMIFDQEDYM